MTKLFKLFTLLMVISLATACNNEDEMSSSSSGELDGTWTAISFQADIDGLTTFQGTTTSSNSSIVGDDLNYNVTFDDGDFTTDGGYTMTSTVSFDGNVINTSTDTYTNVDGSGTYTKDETTITTMGSFFEFEVDGVPYGTGNESQTANYEINADGQLVISQNETQSQDNMGIITTNTIVSQSVWERQ